MKQHETKVEQAINEGLKPGGNLVEQLHPLQQETICEPADAQAICKALSQIDIKASLESKDNAPSPLTMLAGLFLRVGSGEAFEVLITEGLPQLLKIFDDNYDTLINNHNGTESSANTLDQSDLLSLLDVFAHIRCEEGTERIMRTIRHPKAAHFYIWTEIFKQFDKEHTFREVLYEQLANPLPSGLAALCYLNWVNEIAREYNYDAETGTSQSFPKQHPFDSPEGKALIHEWLINPNPEHCSYAHSATAALPFLSNPERDLLLALAAIHPSLKVQMEAAWAEARLGKELGTEFLVEKCLDPKYSASACSYLNELGLSNLIPQEAQDPDFQAMAQMCDWLAHPTEFDKAPNSIELFDKREMFWPPTNDERCLRLYKYIYEQAGQDGGDVVGIGMTGSITFALFGETSPDMAPEDIYALHCCLELQLNNDERAPQKRTIEAGRKILNYYLQSTQYAQELRLPSTGGRFGYCTLEWRWDVGIIDLYSFEGRKWTQEGGACELTVLLNQLGQDGWEAVSSAAGGNWIFWTFKKILG